ncbi:MAG: DNA-formamidopyrimidine glycosylase [Crinalium sp.]
MPELPEVETVRQGLNHVTLAKKILGGDVLLTRTIAHPLSAEDFLAGLKGTAITEWHRRGKYLLASVRDGQSASCAGWLGVHLRMTGQLLWVNQEQPLEKHTRVRLFFEGGHELRFVDQRTFGQMWWVPPGTPPEEVMTGLQKLGLDPFSDDFSVEYLAKQLHQRKRSIKTVLLDQATVAGLGNIYADEALFLSGIKPTTVASSLTVEQIERLRTAIIQVLENSIAAGGTTFSNFLNVQGVNGNYGGIAWVYNRTSQPCRVCNTPIVRLKLVGRSAHFCPQCQP